MQKSTMRASWATLSLNFASFKYGALDFFFAASLVLHKSKHATSAEKKTALILSFPPQLLKIENWDRDHVLTRLNSLAKLTNGEAIRHNEHVISTLILTLIHHSFYSSRLNQALTFGRQ